MITRRALIRHAASGLTLSCLPFLARRRAHADVAAEPHFYLELVFQGGWDTSYLFDARPLAMTAAGKIQNYRGTEPGLYTGVNGQSTWVTELAGPLRPYLPRLAVLNGVHMAEGFDGHQQNKNFLLTGNPFGGESMLPHLNDGSALDYVQLGGLYEVDLTNTGGGVLLEPETALSIARGAAGGGFAGGDEVAAYLDGRLQAVGASAPTAGMFAEGAALMRRGLAASRSLAQRMPGLAVDPEADGVERALGIVREYFRRGIARSALLGFEISSMDCHDVDAAKNQPDTYGNVAARIGAVLKFLAETPFDAAKPDGARLLDVTTVLVASEFGRSMRQAGRAVDDTGTDHNPQSNTVLLGGKGIRGGLVVGESDRRTEGERISAAHEALDPDGVKTMGRPFDVDTLSVREGYLPDVYRPADYLSFASIANTIYSMFGVDARRHWKVEGQGTPAAVLSKLLTS